MARRGVAAGGGASGTDGHGAVTIRRATARDARRLSRLVVSSSAYEGPYAPMVAGYRVGHDYIEAHEVFVAVESRGEPQDPVVPASADRAHADRASADRVHADRVPTDRGPGGRILGFYALLLAPPELDLLFVADDVQGRGIGRLLIAHMKATARAAGLDEVRVVSHPPAEGFYRGVGASRTGTVRANPPAVMWDRPELVIPTA
jgi:GNAT superfamily N-acetyltransferase